MNLTSYLKLMSIHNRLIVGILFSQTFTFVTFFQEVINRYTHMHVKNNHRILPVYRFKMIVLKI